MVVQLLVSAVGLAACAQGVAVDGDTAGSTSTAAVGGGGGSTSSLAGGMGGLGAGGLGAGGRASGGAGATGGDGGTGGAYVAQLCPPQQFVTALDATGVLQCAPITAAAIAGVNQHCDVYAGWRDSCDGCTTAPAKWGHSSGVACTNGLGLDDTCTTPDLGGVMPRMFGLNTDGDVDDNDKFYLGLHCTPPADAPATCAPGTFVTAFDGTTAQCVTAHRAAAEYVGNTCKLYFGWRDGCDSCTSAPLKWGYANDAGCTNGSGVNNTCTTPTLGGQAVNLIGINIDGDVDGNDKFYVGFHCDGAVAAGGPATSSCPVGQLMVGIESDGTLACEDPKAAIEAVVQQDCFVYYGWRDSCDNCTLAPSKWGRVNSSTCQNGVGNDNTCQTSLLGALSIQLFGLNTDGSVGGDDKFYTSLMCL